MTTIEEPVESGVGESLLSELRTAAAKQQEEHLHDFKVGGEFKSQLWIRYKPLDPAPMDRFLARRSEVMDNPRGEIPITELSMDLMAQGCVAMVGADKNGQNKEVLNDLRLDYRLLEFLHIPWDGIEKPTARDVIMTIFGHNAMAIIDHGDDLLAWMRDPSSKTNVGES